MNPKSLAWVVLLWAPGLVLSGDNFKTEIVVAAKTRETVVVHTNVPLSFNAKLVNTDLPEAMKCGNCLHIETMAQGSRNHAASPVGVGFMRVLPQNGKISVDVFHDYNVPRKIEITTEPYKGR